MKKFIVLSIVLLMLAGFVITSSADEITLWAGQNEEVGTLTVEVVNIAGDDFLEVTYDITLPWVLVETHLYVSTSRPNKSAPGQFPYGPGGAVYTIPLTDFMANPIVPFQLWIAAHAVVTNPDEIDLDTGIAREETAWARVCWEWSIRPGKNWATYFRFIVPVVPE